MAKQTIHCENCNAEMEGVSFNQQDEEYDTFWCPKCGTLMNYLDSNRKHSYDGRKMEWKRPESQQYTGI